MHKGSVAKSNVVEYLEEPSSDQKKKQMADIVDNFKRILVHNIAPDGNKTARSAVSNYSFVGLP